MQTDDKLNGFTKCWKSGSGNQQNMNDKLTLKEDERITQTYTVRNANKKRAKKASGMWQNTLT